MAVQKQKISEDLNTADYSENNTESLGQIEKESLERTAVVSSIDYNDLQGTFERKLALEDVEAMNPSIISHETTDKMLNDEADARDKEDTNIKRLLREEAEIRFDNDATIEKNQRIIIGKDTDTVTTRVELRQIRGNHENDIPTLKALGKGIDFTNEKLVGKKETDDASTVVTYPVSDDREATSPTVYGNNEGLKLAQTEIDTVVGDDTQNFNTKVVLNKIDSKNDTSSKLIEVPTLKGLRTATTDAQTEIDTIIGTDNDTYNTENTVTKVDGTTITNVPTVKGMKVATTAAQTELNTIIGTDSDTVTTRVTTTDVDCTTQITDIPTLKALGKGIDSVNENMCGTAADDAATRVTYSVSDDRDATSPTIFGNNEGLKLAQAEIDDIVGTTNDYHNTKVVLEKIDSKTIPASKIEEVQTIRGLANAITNVENSLRQIIDRTSGDNVVAYATNPTVNHVTTDNGNRTLLKTDKDKVTLKDKNNNGYVAHVPSMKQLFNGSYNLNELVKAIVGTSSSSVGDAAFTKKDFFNRDVTSPTVYGAYNTLRTILTCNGEEDFTTPINERIANSISNLLSEAPDTLDTLEEIARWLSESENNTTAAVMATQIKNLQDAVNALGGDYNTIKDDNTSKYKYTDKEGKEAEKELKYDTIVDGTTAKSLSDVYTELSTAISTEATARSNADTSEATARSNADTAITDGIKTEVATKSLKIIDANDAAQITMNATNGISSNKKIVLNNTDGTANEHDTLTLESQQITFASHVSGNDGAYIKVVEGPSDTSTLEIGTTDNGNEQIVFKQNATGGGTGHSITLMNTSGNQEFNSVKLTNINDGTYTITPAQLNNLFNRVANLEAALTGFIEVSGSGYDKTSSNKKVTVTRDTAAGGNVSSTSVQTIIETYAFGVATNSSHNAVAGYIYNF